MDLSSLPAVGAGFPSPSANFFEHDLDVRDVLIEHKEFTFFVRVEGNSMVGAGIHDTDILVVDRALNATQNSVVVVMLNGGCYVKRIQFREHETLLIAEHHSVPLLTVTERDDFSIFGVVTYSLHRVGARLTRGPVIQAQPPRSSGSLPDPKRTASER